LQAAIVSGLDAGTVRVSVGLGIEVAGTLGSGVDVCGSAAIVAVGGAVDPGAVATPQAETSQEKNKYVRKLALQCFACIAISSCPQQKRLSK